MKTSRGVGMAYADPAHPKHVTVEIKGENFLVPRTNVMFLKKKEGKK